jgi:hypothetical protein
MALCIKRIRTDVTPPSVTVFPGRFEDREQAEWALKGIRMSYWKAAKDRDGMWKAHEKNVRAFTFVVISESEAALASLPCRSTFGS